MSEPATSNSEASADDASDGVTAKVVNSISEIGEDTWTACAASSTSNPFVGYAFLSALETADSVGPTETGWLPQHLALEDNAGEVFAVAPTYAKLHSRGEYVFDHAWAEAAHRARLSYYPKLQVAVPFTPVPGPRLLVKPGHDDIQAKSLLASALITLTERVEASSAHLTFLDEPTWQHLGSLGFLQRIDQQFHWHNQNYPSFDAFLATLSSRKRKTIRRERRQAQQSGLSFHTLRGDDITDADWETFYSFYLDTSDRKWGDPYLNRQFFTELGRHLSEACVLTVAREGTTTIAGALHIVGDDCLYGRYWGANTYHPFLHFELCYYQAMEFAITHNIARVEAGAQGEHKLLRGYIPSPTYSAHWISDPDLRHAIERYLQQERRDVRQSVELLSQFTPYRRDSTDKPTS